ncbi:MAG: hypothetical protein QOI95_353 [Acidimicrobiaceae bacterium]
MNQKELQASAQRIGVEADPRAARPFRLAAVRLSDEPPETDVHRAAAIEAAALLVGLALADAQDDLRRLLTPDPAATEVIWTVACYQIGDLTPSAIRDFPDPVEAMATVAACPEEAHVAAELVASTAQGLRWTAVLRTNDLLSFQLPSADTASDASRERPGDLSAALKRWRERLADWSAHAGHERDTESVGFAQLSAIETTSVVPIPQSLPAVVPSNLPSVTSVAFNERFGALEQRLAGLEASIANLTTGIESFTSAAQRRDAAIEQVAQTIDARFNAMASFVNNALADLEHNLGEKVDNAERRVVTTLRDSASDTISRVRDVGGRVSTARRGVEAAVHEEMGTVLLAMRSGLTPLTNEVVQRVSLLEQGIETELAQNTAHLQSDMAVLFDAVASLQRDLAAASAEPAVDVRS